MKYLILLLILFASNSSFSQSWETIDIGNKLSVDFPGKPIVRDIDESRKSYGIFYDSCSLSVLVSKMPPEFIPKAPDLLAKKLETVVGIEKSKKENLLISQDTFSLGNSTGVEAACFATNPNDGSKVKMYRRAIVLNGILYQLTAVDIGQNVKEKAALVKAFFNSMTFRKENK